MGKRKSSKSPGAKVAKRWIVRAPQSRLIDDGFATEPDTVLQPGESPLRRHTAEIEEAAGLLSKLAGRLDSIETQGEQEITRRWIVRALSLMGKIRHDFCIAYTLGRESLEDGMAVYRPVDELTDQEADLWSLIEESQLLLARLRLRARGRGKLSDEAAKKRHEFFELAKSRLPAIAESLLDGSTDDAARTEPSPDGESKPYSFGPGYRSVLWYGKPYSFTDTQAASVEILAQAYEAGTPDVDAALFVGDAAFTQEKIKAKRGKTSAAHRLRDIFRDNPAWGTMIIPGGTRGTYCLKKPESASL